MCITAVLRWLSPAAPGPKIVATVVQRLAVIAEPPHRCSASFEIAMVHGSGAGVAARSVSLRAGAAPAPQVVYSTDQLLDKNKDFVVAEHAALVRASRSPFVQ